MFIISALSAQYTALTLGYSSRNIDRVKSEKMPKGKRKDRGQSGRRGADSAAQSSDDEQDGRETLSVVSNCSDTPTAVRSTDGSEDQDVDDSSAQDNFEDKVKELIEGTSQSQKSAKMRVDSLVTLRNTLASRYVNEFISSRKMTISDCIEKCLKKGKGEEQAAAAMCAVSLLIQLGSGKDGEETYGQLAPLLAVILADNSASCKARSACAEALGLCTFIACEELEQTMKVLTALENTFRHSYCKGDGSVPCHSPEIAALHTSALTAWMLLVSTLPFSDTLLELIDSHLGRLHDVLRNSDVEIRIAAGEAIALLYEIAREIDEEYEEGSFDSLCNDLKGLSTECNKYRAKKDRRQQRSSFRDILHSVENGDFSRERIRIDDHQSVLIGDWITKTKYDAFCHALGSGMKIHLQDNDLLRDVFELGPPLLSTGVVHARASKTERHARHDAAFKARTKGRSKLRDKKQVAIGGD